MDALFLVLCLAVILAGLILFSILVLWLVPVRFSVRLASDPGRCELDISVDFGPVRIVSITREGRTSTEALILGHVLSTFAREPGTAERAAAQKEPPDHLRTASDLIKVIKTLTTPTFRMLGVVYRVGNFERCDGRVRIGLGDPATTGMFYGSYWATRFIFTASRIFILMEPVFDKRLLEMDLVARYRIDHPLRILLQAVRELLRPKVRAGISALRVTAGGSL